MDLKKQKLAMNDLCVSALKSLQESELMIMNLQAQIFPTEPNNKNDKGDSSCEMNNL